MTTLRPPGEVKAYLTVEVFDRQGKRRFYRRMRSRSFVQAFQGLLLVQLSAGGVAPTLPDINNSSYTLASHAVDLNIEPEDNLIGVVVGTGATAVAATDYALAAKIGTGTGSGQLSYGLQVISALSVADPLASYTIQRDFLNSSGASITVQEVGLYGWGRTSLAASTRFMLVRDLVSGGIAVADGANLRVTYTVQTST